MLIKRSLAQALKRYAKFPVIAILGPRQSGKTTLAREAFPNHVYVNFEDSTLLESVVRDPKGFLARYDTAQGIIIDEFQNFPQFLSYIQLAADEKKRPGYFVLTGSQNFLMNQAVTQSLAGRVGILTLLPLSIAELGGSGLLPQHPHELIFNGGYPRIYAENFSPDELYPPHIRSYIERDVRQLSTIENLSTFQKFMGLCAGRIGQLLNIADLATNCGIDQKTVVRWLSVLEASYAIFLLQPHFNNFKKRPTKSTKLYFYDTGLACSLLRMQSANDLEFSPFKGPLFENLIIADLRKQYYNMGRDPHLYFWRDLNGRMEVDCLIDQGISLIPIEIKSSQTAMMNFFDNIDAWSALAQQDPNNGYVVYAGNQAEARGWRNIINWQDAGSLADVLQEKRPK